MRVNASLPDGFLRLRPEPASLRRAEPPLLAHTSSTAVGGATTFAQDAGPAANALTAL